MVGQKWDGKLQGKLLSAVTISNHITAKTNKRIMRGWGIKIKIKIAFQLYCYSLDFAMEKDRKIT